MVKQRTGSAIAENTALVTVAVKSGERGEARADVELERTHPEETVSVLDLVSVESDRGRFFLLS